MFQVTAGWYNQYLLKVRMMRFPNSSALPPLIIKVSHSLIDEYPSYPSMESRTMKTSRHWGARSNKRAMV